MGARKHGLAGSLVALALACGGSDHGSVGLFSEGGAGDGDGAGETASDVGEGPRGGMSSEGDASMGDGSVEGGTSDGGLKLDVGAGSGGPPGCDPDAEDCGCTAVDILFVIDNSGSMFTFQQIIGPVFAGFVDVMIDKLPPGTDLHVGITTQSGFIDGSGNGNWGDDCTTDASPWPAGYTTPDVKQQGGNGHQGRLFEWDGKRYYAIQTDAPPAEVDAMKDWFSSAALLQPPDGDNVEMVVSGAAYALHPVNADYNAGFLRDEGAILMLFFLTDTSDISPGPGKDYDLVPYADMVRDAKAGCGGDLCILTAGVIDLQHPCQDVYPALPTFLEAFGKPPAAVSDIPEGFWIPGFGPPPPTEPFEQTLGEALGSVIEATCEQIRPEG
jgi:hypothetical protein